MPLIIRLLISVLCGFAVLSVFLATAQETGYDLLYSEYVSPTQSYIMQHPINGDPQPLLTITYPSDFDTLLYSPRNGIYAIFDNQAHLNVDGTYVPLFNFPLVDTMAHIRTLAVNDLDFPYLDGTVIVNSATLSHDERFIGLDMTTLNAQGQVIDEFVAVYDVSNENLRIIEVQDLGLNTNRSIDNLRWSPDDSTLAYFYPSDNLTASEHITLVTGCVTDLFADCQIERLQLPPEAPMMESFDWSPDGTRIATSCAANHLDPDNICILSVAGDFIRAYDAVSDTHKYSLEWSPDGQWLAYTGQNLSHTEQDIYILNMETGAEINLSNTPDALESLPFWIESTPDGD